MRVPSAVAASMPAFENDIREELTRQVDRLAGQAEVARQYQTMREQLAG